MGIPVFAGKAWRDATGFWKLTVRGSREETGDVCKEEKHEKDWGKGKRGLGLWGRRLVPLIKLLVHFALGKASVEKVGVCR